VDDVMTLSSESATTTVKWQQIHCQTTQANQAQLSDYFEAEGAVSITFQDAADQPVLEPLPNETPMWSAIIITALFPIEQDMTFVLLGLNALGDDIVQAVKHEQLEEQVWERAWMDDFQPMQFGERVWIYPSQFAVPDDNRVAILLDPGLAFGTGTHPTTALCLTWLDQHPPEKLSVIDYGCGSGILAIAAVKLGADYVLATDIDEQALLATRDNQQRNQIMAKQIQSNAICLMICRIKRLMS
jgi:ribosomal protein L11 methyltransferase